MEEFEIKPIQFYIGNESDFLNKYQKDPKFKEFLDLFDNSDDKYYAAQLFELRPKLKISKASEDHYFGCQFLVYDYLNPRYNLTVFDDKEFFIESVSSIESLKSMCLYFGFDYDVTDYS